MARGHRNRHQPREMDHIQPSNGPHHEAPPSDPSGHNITHPMDERNSGGYRSSSSNQGSNSVQPDPAALASHEDNPAPLMDHHPLRLPSLSRTCSRNRSGHGLVNQELALDVDHRRLRPQRLSRTRSRNRSGHGFVNQELTPDMDHRRLRPQRLSRTRSRNRSGHGLVNQELAPDVDHRRLRPQRLSRTRSRNWSGHGLVNQELALDMDHHRSQPPMQSRTRSRNGSDHGLVNQGTTPSGGSDDGYLPRIVNLQAVPSYTHPSAPSSSGAFPHGVVDPSYRPSASTSFMIAPPSPTFPPAHPAFFGWHPFMAEAQQFMVIDQVALYEQRLDVAHMSYEELLSLGDRVGTVATGLSDYQISGCVKEVVCCIFDHRQKSEEEEGQEDDDDICVICQEKHKDNELLGVLKCKHGFHAGCIKKWLQQKNACPICKSVAV